MTEKYRPANGTEGDVFMERFCFQCKNDDYPEGDGCRILANTFAFDVDDERYPSEWIYDKDGKPVCTAFESDNP